MNLNIDLSSKRVVNDRTGLDNDIAFLVSKTRLQQQEMFISIHVRLCPKWCSQKLYFWFLTQFVYIVHFKRGDPPVNTSGFPKQQPDRY